jgi:methyl-accepting chemotaxis protein
MLRWLAEPAVAVMRVVSTPQKFLLMVLFYSLPLGGAVYLLVERASVSRLWLGLIGLSYLFALYMVLSWHAQTKSGFGGLREAISRLSSGDLGYRPEKGRAGQVWALLYQVTDMSASLAVIFRRVRSSANTVDQAAKEIAAGHVNLSQRTEEQASTLEETASGMEQLAGTVQQNAQTCELASGLSRSADEVAQRGAQTVRRVIERMGMIDRSSSKIADIIGVIEGIAFQTNILALNAAVEAARAGEQGRGFAVVASEVRALAQRSAQAAKEIKALIEESAGNVTEGSKLVAQAGDIIGEIVASVQKVAQLVSQIALASREQNSGVQEINKAIVQMESVTQQNAALVEQATASTLAFEEQAASLIGATAQFKFASAAAPAAAIAGAAPRLAARPVRRPIAARPVIAAPNEDDEWKEF